MTYRYISNFARTEGAKDKKERKRRNVGGYTAGAVGAGLAGAGALGAAALQGKGGYLRGYGKYGNTAGKALDSIPKAMRDKIRKGGYIGGGLALAGAGALGAKAYLNRRANQADASREARNQARYEGSLAGRSKAAVGALKQKASDIRSGAASRYQSAKEGIKSISGRAKSAYQTTKQRAKDTYNRAFPTYE